MENKATSQLIAKIRRDMTWAMKSHDDVVVSTLRSLLARISNAEAIPVLDTIMTASEHVAGASHGVGSTEAARRQLTLSDIIAIIGDEIREITETIEQLTPDTSYVTELRQKKEVLGRYAKQ